MHGGIAPRYSRFAKGRIIEALSREERACARCSNALETLVFELSLNPSTALMEPPGQPRRDAEKVKALAANSGATNQQSIRCNR